MTRSLVKILVLALMPFGNAWALMLDFNCITGNDPDGNACAIGEAQFGLDVTSIGGDPTMGGIAMLFTNTDSGMLLNDGSDPNPSITEIYFDTSLFVANIPQGQDLGDFPAGSFTTVQTTFGPNSGVSFVEGDSNGPSAISPSNLPGGSAIGFNADYGAEAMGEDSNGQSTSFGIQEGDFLTLNISSLPLNLFMAALEAGNFGIGLHVRSFEGDQIDFSESFVVGVNPIPVPAAFWLFGTALIGFIGISRRTRV